MTISKVTFLWSINKEANVKKLSKLSLKFGKYYG